jgi:hypothetical protein
MAVNASWPCVEERDLPPVDVHLVGADVLGDPARLGLDHARPADGVEQRRLPVVDVSHDRHHRRARLERLLGVVEALRLLLLVGGVLDRDLAPDLGRDQLDLLVGQRLRRRPHLAEAHEDLDDVRHRDAERLRQVADADAGLDRDGTRRLRGRLLPALAALPVLTPARLALLPRRAGSLVVDDDPAPAVSGAAAARAERPVRSVAPVRHGPPV